MTAMAARIVLLLYKILADYSYENHERGSRGYHPRPRPLLRDGPIKGRKVATTLRRKTPAASAEAA